MVRYNTYPLHPLRSPVLSKFLRTSYIIDTLQQQFEPRSVILTMKAKRFPLKRLKSLTVTQNVQNRRS